jgi:hypothetical protein
MAPRTVPLICGKERPRQTSGRPPMITSKTRILTGSQGKLDEQDRARLRARRTGTTNGQVRMTQDSIDFSGGRRGRVGAPSRLRSLLHRILH